MKIDRWGSRAGLLALTMAVCAATASAASSDDDAKAVAAIDTQYQAAVKKNDAATMDRILADDFLRVTGKGKVYTKADLLNEARGGRSSRVWRADCRCMSRFRASESDVFPPQP